MYVFSKEKKIRHNRILALKNLTKHKLFIFVVLLFEEKRLNRSY